MKDFFSKCDQIRSFLQIWLHLLKKSLMENIFCSVVSTDLDFVLDIFFNYCNKQYNVSF